MTDPTDARAVLDRIRADLEEIDREIRRHPYPATFEKQEAELDALVPFVATEYYIAQSDLRSFAGIVPPRKIGRTARLFQGYEKMFWDEMARLAAPADRGHDSVGPR